MLKHWRGKLADPSRSGVEPVHAATLSSLLQKGLRLESSLVEAHRASLTGAWGGWPLAAGRL